MNNKSETSPSQTIGESILKRLRSNPDHIAQIETSTGKQSTFAEMEDKSVRCALWMNKHGFGKNDIIVICTTNQLDTYVPIFATHYVGAIYSGWNPETDLESARYLMKSYSPKMVFACKRSLDILLKAAALENVNPLFITFDEHPNLQSLSSIINEQSEDEVKHFCLSKIENPKEVVGVIYLTSGSTGPPKGTMFSHASILTNIKSFRFDANSTYLCYSTLYWLTGTLFLLFPIFFRGTRIIDTYVDVEEACKTIQKYKVTTFYLATINLNTFLPLDLFKRYDLSSIKTFISGGSKTSVRILEFLEKNLPQANISYTFAMTELGRSITTHNEKCKSVSSIGVMAKNVELKVVDLKTEKTCGPLEFGELRCKIDSMMLGYYKNEEATKLAFDKEGWLRCGDLVYYNENNEYFYVDRIKELIKYKNYVLSPCEIEEALLVHPAVMEASVIPMPHKTDNEWPMAFVKLYSGKNVSEEVLIKLSSALGEEKTLRGGIVFTDDIPRTASAKIARHVLKNRASQLVPKTILQ